ncbi:Inositol polyphosphate multikinase [Paramyrothecium foliicola]|nr:Inositol polyphosphate multikinase [Paramyrothecium foliicola]
MPSPASESCFCPFGLLLLRVLTWSARKSAGTLCTDDGELFIKPCTQSEIDFYQSSNRRHPEFADLMPLFMGTLFLSDPNSLQIDEGVAGVISDAGEIQSAKEHVAATIAAEIARNEAEEKRKTALENGIWVPNKSKKISTDKAVVLDNASFGFKEPNILDAKLGVRLWADDAPLAKKQRFDKISSETTHGKLGFRIAGMRVFRGSENPAELDKDEYKIYDKDYGRVTVNNDNVVQEFRKFIFNKAAGIDEDLGKAVCEAFLRDLRRVEDVISRHESRMYSSSLLFVFEGDGEALRAAIEENNAALEADTEERRQADRTTKRVDSGIALDADSDDELDLSSLPQIYSLKLIDFAHAQWTPGQGPDENTLTGVRSLIRIFEEMAQ